MTWKGGRALKYQRRSQELMAFAREVRSTKVAQGKAERLAAELHRTKDAWSGVNALVPHVAQTHSGRLHRVVQGRLLVIVGGLVPRGEAQARDRACLRLHLERQGLGLGRVLAYCKALCEAPAPSSDHGQRFVHVTYSHLWVETKVKRSEYGPSKYKQSRLGVDGGTIAQRGAIKCVTAVGDILVPRTLLEEYWLAPPLQVETVSASALIPAIIQTLHTGLSVMSLDNLR